jgi:hypothetical protein
MIPGSKFSAYCASKISKVAHWVPQALKPGDDVEAAARKTLREKHGRHGSFYDPIPYRVVSV